jgi:hypothetical protein
VASFPVRSPAHRGQLSVARLRPVASHSRDFPIHPPPVAGDSPPATSQPPVGRVTNPGEENT